MKKVSTAFMLVISAWMLHACDDTKKNDTAADDYGVAAIVNDDDKAFAIKAFESAVNVVEISFAEQSKLVNNKAKSFADMVLKERAAANINLMEIAKSKNIMTSPSLSVEAQTAADELSQKSGADLDKAYVDVMFNEYENSVKLFEDGADDTDDPQLKAFAEKNLPILKKHLAVITTLRDSMK